MKLQKCICSALCLILLLSLAACGANTQPVAAEFDQLVGYWENIDVSGDLLFINDTRYLECFDSEYNLRFDADIADGSNAEGVFETYDMFNDVYGSLFLNSASELCFSYDNNTDDISVYQRMSDDDVILFIAGMRSQSCISFALEAASAAPYGGSSVSFPYERTSARDALTPDQQELYDEVLPMVQSFTYFKYTAEEYGYDTLDDLLVVMGAIWEDHPITKTYFILGEGFEGVITTYLDSVYYLADDPEQKHQQIPDEIIRELDIFEAQCQLVVDAIPDSFSTYDKYRYLAYYLSLYTTYDHYSECGSMSANAYGAISGGFAVSEGYARSYAYLCEKAGLYCATVNGLVDDVTHMWNLVKLDSGTYHVDITWCDDDYTDITSSEWFGYFILTQDEITADHVITDGTVADGTPILSPVDLE